MPIPCVTGNYAGLAIFQATADQRYLLGEETFLATHFPVKFWRTRAGRQEMWSEDDLLQDLLTETSHLRGNRVYLLFGAAGAGKSEVMRWLMCRLAQDAPGRLRFTVRISRTELDPVRVVHRILSSFQLPGVDQTTLQRWGLLRNKPVAVANQVVWQALVGLCDRDDEILPLSYRLRPIVEANLRKGFIHMENPEQADRPLELLSAEQLEQALSDAVLPPDISHEQLRARLREAFDDLVLGGVRLGPALRMISDRVRGEFGVRPMLIIDDLVQSMNVYASDLLDYLITLEEGDWDVVVGLTPASFELDRRGRELLVRIRELDTVDDRVTKLDLSDSAGDHSAFLQAESAAELLIPYLDAFKRASGFRCGPSCSHWAHCSVMQWGAERDTRLAPFNRHFVVRLWNGLPTGKGRVRYLLLAARSALNSLVSKGSQGLVELPVLIQRDQFVEHADPLVRALVECFAPRDLNPITIPPGLEAIWGLRLPTTVSPYRLTPEVGTERPVPKADVESQTDPVLVAVRDWLEGGLPNRELLKPLRTGAARLLRDLVDPTLLAGEGRPQCSGVLRWAAVGQGASLPISIEGLDAPGPLGLSRTLGGAAFHLVAYGTSHGRARSSVLQALLSEPGVVELLYRAEELRRTWRQQLEATLGCTLPDLAFHLYRSIVALGGARKPAVMCLAGEAAPSVPEVAWPVDLVQMVESLFGDCFMIREHLWDGQELSERFIRYPLAADSLAAVQRILQKVEASPPRSEFRFGELSLSEFLRRYQLHLSQVLRYAEEQAQYLPERMHVADTYISLADGRRRRSIQRRVRQLEQYSQSQVLIPLTPRIVFGPVHEWKQAADLLRPLLAPKADGVPLVALYRLAANWEQALQYRSVAEVVTWRDGLCRLLDHLERQLGRCDRRSAALPTILLLNRIAELMSESGSSRGLENQTHAHSGEAMRDRLLHTLSLLMPEGFQVTQWVKDSLRVHSERDWSSLAHAIRRASAWWQSYIHQLDVVMKDAKPGGWADALEFARRAGQLQEPTAAARRRWQRFLRHMREAGILDLPILAADVLARLHPTVREWLLTRAEGSALADVEPTMLEELQKQAPEVAQLLWVTMVPEVEGEHGVLRLVDGQ